MRFSLNILKVHSLYVGLSIKAKSFNSAIRNFANKFLHLWVVTTTDCDTIKRDFRDEIDTAFNGFKKNLERSYQEIIKNNPNASEFDLLIKLQLAFSKQLSDQKLKNNKQLYDL